MRLCRDVLISLWMLPHSLLSQVVVPYSARLLWLRDMEPVKAAAVKSTGYTDECLEED